MSITIPSPFPQFYGSKILTRSLHKLVLVSTNAKSLSFCIAKQNIYGRLLYPYSSNGGSPRCLSKSKPISAVSSGLETSITDPKDSSIPVKSAKIVVQSQDDVNMEVRVDVSGEDTQIVFDKVLTNLARTAPPIPGFRRQKGGRTTNVPKSFLLQILGEERVTKFVIQEVVSSTMADYAKKENLSVKDNKINTTQTAEELRLMFAPGNEFGFNVKLELEKSETETTNSNPPEM